METTIVFKDNRNRRLKGMQGITSGIFIERNFWLTFSTHQSGYLLYIVFQRHGTNCRSFFQVYVPIGGVLGVSERLGYLNSLFYFIFLPRVFDVDVAQSFAHTFRGIIARKG